MVGWAIFLRAIDVLPDVLREDGDGELDEVVGADRFRELHTEVEAVRRRPLDGFDGVEQRCVLLRTVVEQIPIGEQDVLDGTVSAVSEG